MAQCTAKSKRSGERCRRFTPPGSKVCHYHGCRAGPPKGNLNALRDGLWSPRLLPSERPLLDTVPGSDPTNLTTDLKLIRIMLARIVAAWTRAMQGGDGLLLDQVESGGDGKPRRVRRRPNYSEQFARLMGVLIRGVDVQVNSGMSNLAPDEIARLTNQMLRQMDDIFEPPPADEDEDDGSKG